MSALQEALAGKRGKGRGFGIAIELSKGHESEEDDGELDSVAEAMRTICPKADPEVAAAAFRRAFEACMAEQDEGMDEEE
jgi:hypothetical protein